MSEPFRLLKPFPDLVTIFSTRADGDMKLRDMKEENVARRKSFFTSRGIPVDSVIGVAAAHGADVIRVGRREAGAVMKHVDGLITTEPGVFLTVTAADCLVLYLYDPENKEVA